VTVKNAKLCKLNNEQVAYEVTDAVTHPESEGGVVKPSKDKFKIRWKQPDGTRIGMSGPTFITKTAATRAARDMREWWGADATELKFEVIKSINGKIWTKVS